MVANNLILCLGDLYIPDRAIEIPEKFQKHLKPSPTFQSPISKIICIGNLTDTDTYTFLESITKNIYFVPGEYDVRFPLTASNNRCGVVEHGDFRIGYVNTTTVVPGADPDCLAMAARQIGADVLIWGGTHKCEVTQDGKTLFVNPGSATGAMSTGRWVDEAEPVPSFALLDVQGKELTVYIYTLTTDENGDEKVLGSKTLFVKDDDDDGDEGETGDDE